MAMIAVELNSRATGTHVRELQNQLAVLGAAIDPDEQAATSFGPSTMAAVGAFRERYGLPHGDVVDAPTGRLMHVASAFASVGSREALRSAVQTAAAEADASQPQELYWLARYATIAGDYETARSIARRVPDHDGIRSVVEPIVALPAEAASASTRQLRPPELPYPENFYTYRRPWVDPAAVERVANDWPSLRPEEHAPLKVFSALQVVNALRQWHEGNLHSSRRRYAAAVAAYDACQESVLTYFDNFYADIEIPFGTRTDRLAALIKRIYELRDNRVVFWNARVQRRRELLSLDELEQHDRIHPGSAYDSARSFVESLGNPGGAVDPLKSYREAEVDFPLVMLAFVLAPMARAEANRARRQFDAALRDLRWVLDSIVVQTIVPGFPRPGEPPEPIRYVYARLACEFIELPFTKLLLAETMLDKADTEYKSRAAAEAGLAPNVAAYQGLKAAQTYLAIKDQFANEGAYVARVDASRDKLTEQVQQYLKAGDTRSREFRLLGNDVPIPTVAPSTPTLPGLDRRTKAHETLVKFTPPPGQEVLRETNPRVYAVLLTAQAKLEQLKAGFNSLGYLDTYVPPWRFQYALERARYFAEHAKNAQREYLNFLSNAEREEFQEMSASQNVEMEKSNVRIETARVDQVRLELQAAGESRQLAELSAKNAGARLRAYKDMDETAGRLANTSLAFSIFGSVVGIAAGAAMKNPGMVLGGFQSLAGNVSQAAQNRIADEQREYEKKNLQLAEKEAKKAAEIAQTRVQVAAAGLVVSGLQRQAALLRHEFALQNLAFLRNRTLSAEQWYRLANSIRSVSETYLRYAVELAFLAEQAYEFEADKRINVIRFDYDLSEVGDFLAGDFLLKDLDTLEQDLIVNQRQREQPVRYVLSMAREFPEALQEIRERGKTTFSLRLEQIEKRFPGLYNVRIGAVDVLPIALMDSTRFSMELTHLGTSQVRLKGQPDTPAGTASSSPLNTNDLVLPDGWLPELAADWPVKIRSIGPETAVFSGLTRQDASAVFSFATASQRHAFEGLGAAAEWQVDFTARDNQVVPGTLADLLITFMVAGYHSPELRRAIDAAPERPTAVTRWLSARQTFPDAFYEFNRSGRMRWNVTSDQLTLTDELGAVRNAALVVIPATNAANFGRVMSQSGVKIRIASSGDLQVLSEIPQVTLTRANATDPLTLRAQAVVSAGADVGWDFGDGSGFKIGASQDHTFAKPGQYTVRLRVVRNGRLAEFTAEVGVSRTHPFVSPVTAFPSLSRDTTSRDVPKGHTRLVAVANAAADDPIVASWRLDDEVGVTGERATFDLKPGSYTLHFSATRVLKACVYGNQRNVTDALLSFNGLSLASNRRFDPDGLEVTGEGKNPVPNALANHLFGNGTLSPVDEWSIELPLSENAFLQSVGGSDSKQYGLGEIHDVILALEYETTPRTARTVG